MGNYGGNNFEIENSESGNESGKFTTIVVKKSGKSRIDKVVKKVVNLPLIFTSGKFYTV